MGLINNYPQFSPKEFIRNCWHCHKEFIGSSGNAKYCSKKCHFDYHIDKSAGPDACWAWITVSGRKSSRAITVKIQGISRRAQAHVWISVYGDIPKGMSITNTCMNLGCVNPKHLKMVPLRSKVKKCLTCGTTHINNNMTKFCSLKCYFDHHTDKTSDPNGCWLWTGTCDKINGGIISFKNESISARRYAYKLYKGETPENFDNFKVRCTCNNHNCVNPAHLRIMEFNRDLILAIYNDDDCVISISEKYNVSVRIVRHIKNGTSWRHVTNHVLEKDLIKPTKQTKGD